MEPQFDEESTESQADNGEFIWKELQRSASPDEFKRDFNLALFSKYGCNNPSIGLKKLYRCRNYPRCPYRLQIFYPSSTTDVVVLHNDKQHIHYTESLNRFNSDLVLKEINNDIKKKPIEIIRELRKKGITVTKIQVRNFKQRIKRKQVPNGNMDYDDLYNWAANKSVLPVSSLSDAPFISYKQFTNNNEFRLSITTRRLIEHAKMSEVLHIDSTYKVMYNGLPLTVCGVTDRARQFHPIMFVVTTGESAEDYEFAMKSINVASEMVTGTKCSFKYLMADCAEAISVANRNVNGNRVKRIFCYYHVISAVRKRLATIKNKEHQKQIEEQIETIQLSSTETEFINTTNLFLHSWTGVSAEVDDFLNYFTSEYIRRNSSWYEGAAPGFPSTNNSIESYNRHIKDDGTLRKQELIGYFLDNIMEFIKEESEERAVGCTKIFQKEVIAGKAEWSQALSAHEKMKRNRFPSAGIVYLNSKTLLICHPSLEFNSIDEYAKFKKYNLSIRITSNNIVCNCRKYQKQYKCIHVLALSVIIGRKAFPFRLADLKLMVKRKRGRPKKILSALERDPEIIANSSLDEVLNTESI